MNFSIENVYSKSKLIVFSDIISISGDASPTQKGNSRKRTIASCNTTHKKKNDNIDEILKEIEGETEGITSQQQNEKKTNEGMEVVKETPRNEGMETFEIQASVYATQGPTTSLEQQKH